MRKHHTQMTLAEKALLADKVAKWMTSYRCPFPPLPEKTKGRDDRRNHGIAFQALLGHRNLCASLNIDYREYQWRDNLLTRYGGV